MPSLTFIISKIILLTIELFFFSPNSFLSQPQNSLFSQPQLSSQLRIGRVRTRLWVELSSVVAGTPRGAGPVKTGQKITAGITNLVDVQFNIEKRQKQGSS
nr:uncharacterized protein LOC114820524 [Malus domestica]